MSRPNDCWCCGVDPKDWWLRQPEADGNCDTFPARRVWCSRCHDLALSLFAALVNAGDMQVALLALDQHLVREVARQLVLLGIAEEEKAPT